jgi:hypothetical protein
VASTYTPNDAINLVTQFAHGSPLSIPAPLIVDQINSMIWRYFPWGWSILSLNPTNLTQLTVGAGSPPTGGGNFTGNQQDYTITGCWFNFPINLSFSNITNNNFGGGFIVQKAPNGLSEAGNVVTINTSYAHNLPTGATLAGLTGTITGATVAGYNTTLTITSVPSNTQIVGTIATGGLGTSGGSGDPNILRPLKMRIARLDTNPPEYRELAALGNLSPELSRTASIETMKAVGWFSSQNFFRFDVAPQVSQGQIVQLLGEYQFMPTKITSGTLGVAFPFPDEYFNVLENGLLWRVYQLLDDQRAGGAQISENGNSVKQYTGAMGQFMYALKEMARTEDLGSGDEFRFPEQPIGVGRSYWPGLYGV